MEIEKHLQEAKTLVSDEQQLRSEVSSLNLELAIEEQNLDILKTQEEKIDLELDFMRKFRDSQRAALEVLKADRARLNNSELQTILLRTCLNKMKPVSEAQLEKYNALQSEYQKLLKLYEQQPLYQQIIQEAAQQRSLEERIQELNNEIPAEKYD